jgi:hypothetical protein
MGAETDGDETPFPGGADHGFNIVLAVAKIGMGMETG